MTQNNRLPAWYSRFDPSWQTEIGAEMQQEYFRNILQFLHDEKLKGKQIYPNPAQVFDAFHLTPFNRIKAVILGQDPYHGPGQAHGLSFSVQPGVPLPPSLSNIYKELYDDLGIDRGHNGCLTDWAQQGVLLLNASLTVERGLAMSHQKIGWQRFTDFVIRKISDDREHVVFILWGRFAQQKENLIDSQKHFVIKSAHPSPLSAHNGFFGSHPFSKTNDWLASVGLSTIKW
ncbi:MAG TPA: uracil-DNA glycosylase [Edaphocola sp.]|nr:uracil-DNA glycosylase [Edaphocola sp.]